MTMPCGDAAELVSRNCDVSLEWPDRLALYSHLLLCTPCRRLRRQLTFLTAAMRHWATRDETAIPPLSLEVRERILNALGEES
ncbi:MAG: hypothetical protein AB7O59_23535 [Pirellulales bacterium]